MSISERINPDQLNIHQFQEVPELTRPELPFDVERDINEGIKGEIRTTVENTIVNTEFVYLACNYKVLFPNETINGRFTLDELIKVQRQHKDYWLSLKTLYPSLDIKTVNPDAWDEITTVDRSNTPSLIASSCKVKTVEPGMDLNLTAEEIQAMLTFTQQVIGRDKYYILACYRLINPAYVPQLNSEEWSVMQERLVQSALDGDWLSYTNLAFEMKILAAHSVKISSPGVIEFQMYPPNDLNQSTPPMPEPRKF